MARTKSAINYQTEIHAWASHNFCYLDKTGLGVGEEIGECLHAILKFKQKIRSSAAVSDAERKTKLDEDLKDGIADAMIYCLHLAETNETFLSFMEAEEFGGRSIDNSSIFLFGKIMISLGQLFMLSETNPQPDEVRPFLQHIFGCLFGICTSMDYGDPVAILNETWEKVRTRDWIKFPKDGRTE